MRSTTVTKACMGAAFSLVLAGTAQAQDPRIEIGGSAGWTNSDGVTFDGIVAGNGNLYDGIAPKDSFSWSLTLGYLTGPNTEIGFLFDQQKSTLTATGTTETDIGDLSVSNYHGYFAYNFGEPEAKVRPYILLGLGATHYGGVPFSIGGFTGETNGSTQFSGTFGAGLKLYASDKVGVKLGARYTPTYIKSDSEGWYCDPYWGCYVVGDPQYSNQFEFSGGLVFRF
jgi:outer membrane protein with beta-barrel domain